MGLFYASIGTVLILSVMGLTFAVAIGKPYGEYTMGGRYRVLPMKMRYMAVISLFIQLYSLIVLLHLGNVLNGLITHGVVYYSGLFFAVYFGLNTFMNLLSKSKKERNLMTLASLLLSICYFMLWLSYQ